MFAFFFINAKPIKNKTKQDSTKFDRKWEKIETPFNKTTKTGLVVLNVCINPDGTVFSASYNEEKSTTNDTSLINTSIKAANSSLFTKDTIQNKVQCGTIKYKFKNE